MEKSIDRQIEIVDFTNDESEAIKTLNYEWLERFFHIEEEDKVVLSNPQREIIDKGGFIYYARLEGEIVGTVTLLKDNDEVFFIGKMAVSPKTQGMGIGNLLLEHLLNQAKLKGVKKLVLFSNTILQPALRLYRKYGFTEIELGEPSHARSNVKMEKIL